MCPWYARLHRWSFGWASSFFKKQVNIGVFPRLIYIQKHLPTFITMRNSVFGNMLIANWVLVRKWGLSIGERRITVVVGGAGGELGGNFKGGYCGREDFCTMGHDLVPILLLMSSVISTFIVILLRAPLLSHRNPPPSPRLF